MNVKETNYRQTEGQYYPKPMAYLYNCPDISTEHWHLHCKDLSYPNDAIDMLRNGTIPGKYLVLNRKGGDAACVMSDTPMEKYTNQAFIDNAYGDILIVGLGIGMLLPPLIDKTMDCYDDDFNMIPERCIKSVTIVEKDKELIDIMKPLIEEYVFDECGFDKFEIINDDAYTYAKNHTDKHYDWVYIDIWDDYIGYEQYLRDYEELLEPYRKIADHVDAWGYQNALDGRDEVPTEQAEYSKYMVNLLRHYRMFGMISNETFDNVMEYAEQCG